MAKIIELLKVDCLAKAVAYRNSVSSKAQKYNSDVCNYVFFKIHIGPPVLV